MALERGRQALPEGHPGRAVEPPAPEPLIEGILDAGTVTMLSGPFSTGKSFIALDWALSIASGTDWLGRSSPRWRTDLGADQVEQSWLMTT